jgi:hypothetical protein
MTYWGLSYFIIFLISWRRYSNPNKYNFIHAFLERKTSKNGRHKPLWLRFVEWLHQNIFNNLKLETEVFCLRI